MDCTIREGDNIKFQPHCKNSQVQVAETISPVSADKTIMVRISNSSNDPISLNKNMRLGTVSRIATVNSNTRNMEEIKKLRREELKESDFDLSHLDRNTRDKLLKLLFEFSDIFSKRLYTIGKTEAVNPTFTVDRSKLPSTRPYTVPFALRNELKRQLDELEEANLIERSNSHISFPLLLVKKRNPTQDPKCQEYRAVADLRNLNKHLKYPRYKLPIMQHLLEKLRGAKCFSSLDLSSSFWQIGLKPEDRDVTTFSTPFGSYRYCSLPQGFSLSPEVFAQLSDQILAPITHLNIANYIDDFAVGGENTEDMLYKLRQLFQRFRLFGLTLNPKKCSFLLPKIQFLGHELDGTGIQPLDTNLRKISDFPVPNTVRKIRRFIGLIGYYRKFIPNFSALSAPLTDLTKQKRKFRWTEEAQQAFETLKTKLDEPPILIHPNFDKEFILTSDSSDTAIAAFLGQKDNFGIIHPIAYFSKKLNPTQKRYIIMEKELLAIVEAVKSFKYYLYGRSFTIRCDNLTLTKLGRLECPGNRVARWISFLSDYNYKYELIKTTENHIADALSRDFFLNSIQIDLPSIEEIKQAQREDNKLKQVISDTETRHTSKITSPYSLLNGLLVHNTVLPWGSSRRKATRIVIPDKYKPHILTACHAAHFGFRKTYNAIRVKYFWENLYSDTKHFVSTCKHCISYRSPNVLPPVPLQRHFIPTRPMQYVSSDLIGRLPRTERGNCYVISFLDHFTKFVKWYAVPDQSAETTAECFLDYISIFGVPERFLTDRGSNFTSDLFQNLCKRLGVIKLQTSAFHAMGNGQSEILNSPIKKALSILAQETKQWDEYVNFYTLLYNSSYHTAINDTPSYLHLGFDVTLPTDLINSRNQAASSNYSEYVQKKTHQLQHAFEKVRRSLIQAAENQEAYQARFAKDRNFQEGDLVFLYQPDADRNAQLVKRRSYVGPYRILTRHNDVNFSVVNVTDPREKVQKVHSQRLILYSKRKAELDYLHSVIKSERHTPKNDTFSPSTKPHATFDEVLDTDLLLPSQGNSCSLPHESDQQNNEKTADDDGLSAYSGETQCYDGIGIADTQQRSPSSPQASEESYKPTHGYSLRPRQNLAEKILDWGLQVTQNQDNASPPGVIKFLDKLSDALNK